MLTQENEPADVYKLCVIHPLPSGLCEALAGYERIVFAEECVREGGIGEHLAAALLEVGYKGKYHHAALPAKGVAHAAVEELRTQFGLDAASLVRTERGML